MQNIVNIIILSFFAVGSYFDIKYRRIPNTIPAAIFAAGIFRMCFLHNLMFLSAVTGLLIPLIIFVIVERTSKDNAIGGGDYKLYMAAGFCYGSTNILMIMFISFLSAYIFSKIRKEKALPLCPFAMIGMCFAII